MANEISFGAPSGFTDYILLRNSTSLIYNGASFVTYVTANYTTYTISATEQGTASGFYTATMPAVAAGVYEIIAKQQAGGSPAETDLTVAEGDIQWSGTAIIGLSGVTVASLISTALNSIADQLLQRDLSNVEAAAAVHSLASAALKLVSRFNLTPGFATTFRTDGVTAHMTQTTTNDATLVAIKQLGVGT